MNIDFSKSPEGLVPAVIQDDRTRVVLMLGYMNAEALDQTGQTGRVTFYARSKQRLWTKGETSGNYLNVVSMKQDCDGDTILIRVNPVGPVCHAGSDTCFSEVNDPSFFPEKLESVIEERMKQGSLESYTARLVSSGVHKVAQKVGEEAVELVIESMRNDDNAFLNEAADLLYHYTILLKVRGYSIGDIAKVLEQRHQKSAAK